MASERPARNRRRRGDSQEDAALDALLERIFAVNPTGRALSRRHERALYEEKAHLQSQLVEEFGERVVVRVHDDMPGIVSLSVPSLDRSAGHAVLGDLSVRARDVLEARLSAKEVNPSPEREPRPRPAPESDVERALRFIDDYDFECAERLLRERVGAANADAPRALDVLILLYADYLGRDDDALRAAQENRPLKLSFESRLALGRAAMRIGRFDLALEHLRCGPTSARANAVAEVVRGALRERAWPVVQEGIELLRRDATYQGVGVHAGLREEEERVRSVLQAVSAEEISMEGGLADLVDLLLPNHPARVALRDRARERRCRESVERLLERLDALEAAADRLAVAAVIADLEPMRDFLSEEERALVDRASRALKSQRVEEAAREIVDLAQRSPDEATLLSYLRLPSDVRAEARRMNETGLLELVELLSTAPHGDRAIARAAAAWHDASHALPEERAWTKIAPHAVILAHVPEIARVLAPLRSVAPGRDTGAPVVPREAPAVRSSSRRLRGAIATASQPVEEHSSVVLADGLVHVDGAECVAAVHRVSENVCEVRLHAVQSGRSVAPIIVHLVSDPGWRPISAVASGADLHLVTTEAEHHVVSFAGGITVRDGPPFTGTDVLPSHVVCEGRLVAISASGGSERVVWGASQPTRARIQPARLDIRRSDESITISTPRLEPWMLIESPKGAEVAPVLVELEQGSDRAFVWQQMADDLWRGFRLREAGVPIAAWTLPSRGVLVATRSGSGPTGLRIARLTLEGDHLRPARTLDVVRGLGVVVDAARRRAWAVALDETMLQLSVLPIGLRRAHRPTSA
ncbi:MAG: hypothetical protein U0270_41450 [Labilithrix sp.]